ncbi:hypothetical protein PIB30_006952 [Stylosanthes scabra]|uniref:Uncharacterized protein n=1 Tax=Stylosanthes scabra TaxID=79078 RepID=A0ABU6Y2S2_9FABA|nr:hypothetical protein [Stylosanthes scabra]
MKCLGNLTRSIRFGKGRLPSRGGDSSRPFFSYRHTVLRARSLSSFSAEECMSFELLCCHLRLVGEHDRDCERRRGGPRPRSGMMFGRGARPYRLIQNSFKSILLKGRENGDQRYSWLRLFPMPINCAWDLLAPRIGNVGLRPPVLDSSRAHRQPSAIVGSVEIEQSKAVKAKANAKAKDEFDSAVINFKVM